MPDIAAPMSPGTPLDLIWHDAPWPALRLRVEGDRCRASLNPAAEAWALAQGLSALALQTLAETGALASAGLPSALKVVPLPDGQLLWLSPADDKAGREPSDAQADRARLVAEALRVGFWSREGDTGAAFWDESMYRIYGLDPALGPPRLEDWLTHFVHPQDQQRMRLQALRRDAGTGPHDGLIEATFRITDGAAGARWVQSWTRRVERAGRRWSYGMHVDVSERQLAEQQAEHERLRTQLAIDAAGVGIWERAPDGQVRYWNEAMYRLRGLSPDDPRPHAEIIAQTVGEEDRARFIELRRQHLAGTVPYRHEFRVRQPDGQVRWLATEGQALRDAQGRLLGMAGVNFDVTERKTAELLQQQAERLEQASRDKSAFMTRMSHELRTPMNAVLGFTRLLQDDPHEPPSPRQLERLAHIARAGGSLMALIDDLLQIGQREAEPAPAPVPTAALRVLCVEDNLVNLQLVRELIALRPAVRLRTAETGGDGIQAALAEPPDLLLLDLQLPDQHGIDVMRTLRAAPAMANCRIVALSADAMPEHIQTALAAGFDEYWTKPIQFEHFLAGIDRLAAACTERTAAAGPPTAPSGPRVLSK